MADKKEYLSKEKYEELVKELSHLKTVRRKEVAASLEYSKALGDLSENAEYQEAREEQAELEDRISRLEAIMKSAEIMELHHSEKVDVGATVHVQKQGDDKKMLYKVVGSEEADITTGKISLRSPIGEAMMGKKKGENFTVKTPKGDITYKVVDIE